MHSSLQHRIARAGFIAAVSAALLAGVSANAADVAIDFKNPAVTLSSEAVIASGTCIAKYAVSLEDASKPAAEIGQRVAQHCALEISRSAGLASWMVGKPEDFGKNLKYTSEVLTAGTVERMRAAHATTLAASL